LFELFLLNTTEREILDIFQKSKRTIPTVSIMRRTKSLNRKSVEKHEAIMRISSMEAVNVGSNLTEDKKINMKISFKENVFEMLKVQEKFAREVIVYLR